MQILVSCVLQQQKNIHCHIFNVTVAFEEEEMYQKLRSNESKENSIAQHLWQCLLNFQDFPEIRTHRVLDGQAVSFKSRLLLRCLP